MSNCILYPKPYLYIGTAVDFFALFINLINIF
jgi:hypothetical protein